MMHWYQSQVTIALAAFLVPLLMGCGSEDQSRGLLEAGGTLVRINEIQPSLEYPGPAGFADWIELYNAGKHDANLEGYFITDDPERPFKHMLLPGVVVPAKKGFLVLLADSQTEKGPLHLSFSLSEGGESVELRAPDGNLVDGIDFPPRTPPPLGPTCADPKHPCDFSYARIPDGSGAFHWCAWLPNEITPNASNGSTCRTSD